MSQATTEDLRAQITSALNQLHMEIGQIRTRLMLAKSGAEKDQVAIDLRQQERRIGSAELELLTIEMLAVAGRMPALTALLAKLTGFLTLGQAVKDAVSRLPKSE